MAAKGGKNVDLNGLTDKLGDMKIDSNINDNDYTEEERTAVQAVKDGLIKEGVEGKFIDDRCLTIVTLIAKCRVEKSIKKYKEFVGILTLYDLTVTDITPPPPVPSSSPSGSVGSSYFPELDRFWDRFEVSGRDKSGRCVMWIGGGKTMPDEEQLLIRCSCMYFLSVHSDIFTLRNGCSFVLDTSNTPATPVGNEKKLQKVWQAFPLRPQGFFIVGATYIKRLFINGLLKIAALFSNAKVLKRIQFIEMKDVSTYIDPSEYPSIHGGKPKIGTKQFVSSRHASFSAVKTK